MACRTRCAGERGRAAAQELLVTRARARDRGDHETRCAVEQPGRASGVEARAGLELATGQQVLEQVAPDPLAGRGELLLRLDVDLGGVRRRDLEVAGQVRRERKRRAA